MKEILKIARLMLTYFINNFFYKKSLAQILSLKIKFIIK